MNLHMRTQKIIAEYDKENITPNNITGLCHDKCCIVGEQVIEEETKEEQDKSNNKKKLCKKKSIPPKLQNVRKWKTERNLKIEFD